VIFFQAAPLRRRSKAVVLRKPERGVLELDHQKAETIAETAAAATRPDERPGSRLRSTARS